MRTAQEAKERAAKALRARLESKNTQILVRTFLSDVERAIEKGINNGDGSCHLDFWPKNTVIGEYGTIIEERITREIQTLGFGTAIEYFNNKYHLRIYWN
jgi:hypothetical protein